MMLFATLFLLGLANFGQGEEYFSACQRDIIKACGVIGGDIYSCNANYSNVHTVEYDLQRYAALHIEQNWNYLLMSAYFNSYEVNREGLSRLYRKLADDVWEDTLSLVKYMAKRGFNMDYNATPMKKVEINTYKMSELNSLAYALDVQKLLAETAHEIHNELTVRKRKFHDAETINFLTTEFVSKHAYVIRTLSGLVNDLHQLIKENKDPSLAIHHFDRMLADNICILTFLCS